MEIKSKNDIIDYFASGIKQDELIGVENEQFLFNIKTNKRAEYENIKKLLQIFITKFGWQEIKENENLIGLKFNGKSISLEPGNQIELSGDKLKNIHEVCVELHNFQKELDSACFDTNLTNMATGYDPVTKLKDAPNNPKERYKIMTNEMPKGGELSLNMMYQTSGTQVNMDYSSEEDFKKKFKLMCYLTPLAIGIFANSAVYENRASGYLSYRAKVWQNTARAGLPKIFLENMDFEKYADFIIKFPLLFIEKNKGFARLLSREALSANEQNVVDATNQFYERLELNFKQILQKDSDSLLSQPGISSHLLITSLEGTISRYIRSKFKEKPSSYIENIWTLLQISLFK